MLLYDLSLRCLPFLAMVAFETLLTAVVSSISPGTMKSTVVVRSIADSELLPLSPQ